MQRDTRSTRFSETHRSRKPDNEVIRDVSYRPPTRRYIKFSGYFELFHLQTFQVIRNLVIIKVCNKVSLNVLHIARIRVIKIKF